MVGVTKNVITLMEVFTVPVNLVITFQEEIHVLVRHKLILCVYCLSSLSDINECNSNNGNCDQNCINQPGTYHCTCNTGYTLSSNLRSCIGKY